VSPRWALSSRRDACCPNLWHPCRFPHGCHVARATCESRRERVAARRPTVRQRIGRANAPGIGWCRRVAERKLHSRARIERSSGCARASFQGCRSLQATLRFREACLPVANGARGRGPSSPGIRKDSRGAKRAARIGVAAAKPRTRGSPEPGAREGVAGQGFLARWKVSRIGTRLASFTRTSRCRSWRLSSRVYTARAVVHGWKARQGYQRYGRHAS
jgi:hypothetical protein